jgi:predicted DCC family thiol-disulfide oxidoreductase YuxK
VSSAFYLCSMVILFDGVCNMCNAFVRFVIKRDKHKIYQFASLQSKYGTALLTHFNLSSENLKTVILFDGERIFTRSDASIKVISSLGGIWKTVLVFKIVPRFIRNGIYNLLAKNRYAIFGKSDQCSVPTEDVKDRFLDDAVFTTKK